jgi:hypothetical protein
MSRINGTFDFVGNISIPKNVEKFNEVKESASGWEGHRLNFAIQESKTNSVFVELYGGFFKSKGNVIKTLSIGKKGSNLEIPWDERLKEETVDMVADFKKVIVDFTTDEELKKKINQLLYQIRIIEHKEELSDKDNAEHRELKTKLREIAPDRYEFISSYDAVVLLASKLEQYKEHKLQVSGSIDYNYWNGNYFRKFNINSIEIVSDDTPSKLKSLMDIFFVKGAVDDKDMEKDKKIYIDGYVQTYNRSLQTDIFVPQQFVINTAKIDFANDEHVKRLEYFKKQFDVKGKGVYHLQWQVNIFRGADKVEFTEKDLTQAQKEAISFGLAKLEDYAPKGGMLGDSVYENRLVKPNLVVISGNDFTNGSIESEFTQDDLDIVPVPTTKKEDKPEKPKQEEKKPIVELDDLFG